jgi:hypothetical protein
MQPSERPIEPERNKPGEDPAHGEPEPSHGDEGRDPHHALNNPVGDPDPTEWPDPYEKREDPRGPERQGGAAGPSTSEPHPPQSHERARREGEGKG